jgi:cell division protein FtsX
MLLGMDSPSVLPLMRRGFNSLSRDKRWGTTLLMLCLSLTLLQMLVAGLVSLRGIGQLFTAKSGIHMEVLSGAADRDIQELYGALSDLPYVSQVEYVPKEKAYEREKLRDPSLIESLEKFAVQNPFPDTFSVTLSSIDAFSDLKGFVEQQKWQSVIDPSFLTTVSSQERELQSYLLVSRSVTTLVYLVLWVGVAALLLLIIDIVMQRAYERKEELELETVMGASAVQVVLPLAAEIGLLLLGALIIGFATTTMFLLSLPAIIPGLEPGGAFAEARAYVVPLLVFVFPFIAVAEAAALLAAAGMAGMLALKGHLPSLRFRS